MHSQPDKNKDDKALFGLQEIWELELRLSVIFPPYSSYYHINYQHSRQMAQWQKFWRGDLV